VLVLSLEDGTYRLSVIQEICNYHLTFYAVYCVAFTHIKNCYLSFIRQLWTVLTVFDTWGHVQLTPPYLET